MSKKGKVGTIIFFLLSIGITISALKIIGNIEEGRKEIERLTASLEETMAELASVKEERTVLEEELELERECLEKERRLTEKLQRELSQKIREIGGLREEVEGLQREVRRGKEEKDALGKRFEELEKERAELEERYQDAQQVIANLQVKLEVKLGELLPPVENIAVEDLPMELPLVLVEGKVINTAWPFLNLELNSEVVADLKPALSIYRRNRLIKELDTKRIKGATIIVKVALEGDLEGIGENDQVALGFSQNVEEMFILPYMEGRILDVIRPGFLSINLGREGLEDAEPILLVYRDGELFRKIGLKSLDNLTILVETVEGTNIRGIREEDTVRLTR